MVARKRSHFEYIVMTMRRDIGDEIKFHINRRRQKNDH